MSILLIISCYWLPAISIRSSSPQYRVTKAKWRIRACIESLNVIYFIMPCRILKLDKSERVQRQWPNRKSILLKFTDQALNSTQYRILERLYPFLHNSDRFVSSA